MKLYDGGRAPNPRRVRIFLAEKGITVETTQVDFMKGEQHAEDFVRLNPARRVPVLVLDDGTVIAESVAICRYFEELQPEPPLFGRTPKEKAIIEMWNRRIELGLLQSVAAVARHGLPSMAAVEAPQLAAWADLNRDRLGGHLEMLDNALAAHPFVAGNEYSIADITALVAVDFMRLPKLVVPDHLTHIHRWRQQLADRPSTLA